MSPRVARVVSILVVAALATAACGGGSDDDGSVADREDAVGSDDATSTDNGQETPDEVAVVPASLLAFGDLVDVRGTPKVTTFDTTAGSLVLDDTATVTVPAGAFGAPTEVTATTADLAFDRYADNAPTGTAYVLSTSGDITLDQPLTLSITTPPDSATVAHHVDGVWQPIEPATSADGTAIEVPITHFSDNATIVVQPPGGDTEPTPVGAPPDGNAPAEFLRVCLVTMKGLLLKRSDKAVEVGGLSGFEPSFDDGEIEDILAYVFCGKALVKKYSPEGADVDLGCVDVQLAAKVAFQTALANCLVEESDAETTDESDAEATDEPLGDDDGQPGTGDGSEQGEETDGRYVGSLDDPGSIFDVEVGDNSMEVVVEGGSVTEFSLGLSGRYSACFGYRVEGEVSCTVWLTWDLALSGGPVAISEGSADVPVSDTQTYSDCESEFPSECKDWDNTEVGAATARISFTEATMTG